MVAAWHRNEPVLSDEDTTMAAPSDPSGRDHDAVVPAARVLVSSAVTAGACSVVEMVVTAESALPAHVHEREDQALIVLAGSLDVTVGDHRAPVQAGDVAFCPRGVVHAVGVTSASARVLAVHIPGGLEGFVVARSATHLDPELLLALAAEHGVRICVPPLETAVQMDR